MEDGGSTDEMELNGPEHWRLRLVTLCHYAVSPSLSSNELAWTQQGPPQKGFEGRLLETAFAPVDV